MEAEYNYEAGKFYNTIFFLTMYFFEEDIIEKIFTKYGTNRSLGRDLYFYREIKTKCNKIPNEIIPFCYCNYEKNIGSFLISYISDNFTCNYYLNLENFVCIFSDKEKLKKSFIKHYFPTLTENDYIVIYNSNHVDAIGNIIFYSDILDKYKICFLLTLLKFESHVDLLIDTIKNIFISIDQLINRNYTVINKIIKTINNDKNNSIEKLKNHFKLSEDKSYIFMFSLLNPYGIFFSEDNNKFIFRVGENFLTIINYKSDYNHVNSYSYAKILSNETRYKIYKMFFNYNSLCITDIAHCLKVPRTEISWQINEMFTEKIVVKVKGPTPTLYYALDDIYLNKIAAYVAEERDNYEKFKNKGQLNYYVRPKKNKRNFYNKR